MNRKIVEIWNVLSFFIFFSFKSSSWIITTYVDDYLNGFLVTKPCRDSERPIILFPPKATSKIFLQSWFFIFLCRALQKHLRTWYWKERRYCFWRTHLELSDKRWSSYIMDFLPWRNDDFPFQVMFVTLRSNFQSVFSWWGTKNQIRRRMLLVVTVFAWRTCATFLHTILFTIRMIMQKWSYTLSAN